ncbi:hypothetical protein L3Y34_002601 [Caenorhabditis briggsae]|uniref:Uncharacterized protein n=1 Tax=Caenorhabditis briggsae TaxID=6238 RepID=A0AAE9IRW0_CAEBR|nr:hypothetical protein L3Y34_002601 [Caenorhabditis briggsae]
MSVSSNLIENQINKGILKLKEDWNLKMEKDSELIDLVTKELLINSGGLRQDGQDLSVNLPKFFAADQTWLELQMRIGYSENPQNPLIPQTSVYLPGICTGELAPKHPFGVPSYHYYTCPSNRGTISRKSTYDYVLCPKYHGHRPKVQISNAKVTLEPFGAFPAMELWSFGENAIYSTPDQHCSARFNASKLVLSNGRLIDELGGKEVKIVMNNQFELKEKIQKIAFSVKTNFVEVLMLLENFTMASGCVFENMRKNKLNVSIFEMPGTYGTTDFQCSPDFKSMVRVSQMERKIRKMSKIEEKIEYNSECIRHILKRVMQLYEAQNWNQMHSMEWFKLACQFCQCTVTAGKRLSNPDERTEIPDYLTPREKIVNLSTVETEECGHREPCLNAWDLIAIGRRIAEGKFEVCWGDDKAELLAEYSHQVLIALYGLADLFGNHKTMNGRDKRSKIASLNLYQFYSMSVKHLISCFEISALAVRVIILDIACLKATPSQYAQILELYPVAPKLVARVVRKYPQLILFGNSPIFPPIRLIRLAGYMLNRTTSEFEKSREKEIELVDLTMDTEDVEDLDVIFIKNVKASEVIRQAPEEVTEAMEPEDAEVVILEESSEDDEVSEYSPEFNYAAEYVDSEDVMPESSTNDTYEIAARGDSEDVTADAQEAIESDGDLESENPEARESPEVATSSKAPESKNPELQDPEDVMPQTSKFQDSQKSENPEDVAPEDAPEAATSEAPESKNPEDGSSKSPIRFSFPEHPSTSRTTPDSEATKIPLLSPGGRKPYTQVIAELVGDDDFEIPPGVSPYRNTLEGQKRMREKRVADEPTTSSRPPKTSRKKILEDVTPRKRHPLFSKSTIPKFRGDYDITTEFTKEANKKKGEEGAVADRTRRKKASTQDRIQKVMKIGQKKRGK